MIPLIVAAAVALSGRLPLWKLITRPRLEQDNVCRYSLILVKHNKVADLDLARRDRGTVMATRRRPRLLVVSPRRRARRRQKHLKWCGIAILIPLVPLIIIKGLLANGNGKDEAEGRNVRCEEADLEGRQELGEGDEEEVKIEEELELFVEYQREESDEGILLVANDVGRMPFAARIALA